MTISTLLKYFVGNREAILTIARCPQAIWIGLLFVLAAGFAREYDGEDLLHEPWHLLIPLTASLVSSAVLYLLVRLIAWLRGSSEPSFVAGYRTFLTLYWMTAPLALIYAIPLERFLSSGDAMRANLWLLAIVAGWRVILITRVSSVLYHASFWAAWFPVMLFADSVTLAAISLTSLPLLSIMGGVRLSESDEVLLMTTLAIGFIGYCSWLVWFFGTVVVAIRKTPRWQYQAAFCSPWVGVSRAVWLTAFTSLAVWLFVLPFTQPEQILRRRVEAHFAASKIQDALVLMSAHEKSEFPPYWDPPPRITYPDPRPDMTAVQETAVSLDLKSWVRQIFDKKFADSLRGRDSWIWDELPAAEVDRRLSLIEKLESRDSLAADLKHSLEMVQKRTDISSETQVQIKKLLNGATNEAKIAQPNGDQATAPVSP
jgi:hypothetical protein